MNSLSDNISVYIPISKGPSKIEERCCFAAPLGELEVVIQDSALVAINFISAKEACKHNSLGLNQYSKTLKKAKASPLMLECRKQLREYFAGKRQNFELVYRVKGTPFQEKVWKLLSCIPYGQTKTYGELAQLLGGKQWSRAVGGANNKNPLPLIIPCHRVIGSKGELVGYAPGVAYKRYLLELESFSKCSTRISAGG